MAADGFGHDRFLVEQLIRPIANLYRITPLAVGETPAGGPVAFVRQKKMAIKEDIRFYADEQETEELFRIKARRMIDVGGRYDVTTPRDERIGVLERAFAKSLLRSTWRVLDAGEQELALVQETNVPIAILRRVIDALLIPYNFTLLSDGREIGQIKRQLTPRDRYLLDLAGDTERRLDRRLAVALAVGLDTLQDR